MGDSMLKIIIVGLLGLSALPVGAAVVDVVIRGNVSNAAELSSDTFNAFYGALVPGAAYTARFTYDTNLGVRSDMTTGRPADYLSGEAGAAFGIPIRGSLTIGGTRYDVLGRSALPVVRDRGFAKLIPEAPPILLPGGDPEFPDDVVYVPDPTPNRAGYGVAAQAYNTTSTQSEYGSLIFGLAGPLGTFPGNLETSYSLGIRANPTGSNQIPVAWGNWAYGFSDRATGLNGSSRANLVVSRITVVARPVPVPSPVPLPASLPLLAFALLLLGLSGNRAKKPATLMRGETCF